MNKKQQDILEEAHKLFIEKGYLDTSIQDILERSGISKGTFYKYFSSKSELLLSLLSTLQESMIVKREKLVDEHTDSDCHMFEKQMIFMMHFIAENNISKIIETTLVLNERKIFHYIEELKISTLNWIYKRFQQIFPKGNYPQLFDGAVLFDGMLNNVLRTNKMLNTSLTIEHAVRYCMEHTKGMMEKEIGNKDPLFDEKVIASLFEERRDEHSSTEFIRVTAALKRFVKNNVVDEAKQKECLEFITFIYDEVLQDNASPRKFIINSSLSSLEQIEPVTGSGEMEEYKRGLNRFIGNSSTKGDY
jgi:AcrR family transcriptional regulator